MKKALILGANAGQVDIIDYLKNEGWYVLVCSNNENDPGSKLADEYFRIDIRNEDEVANLAVENEVKIVYSVSSDIAIKSATNVSEKLGLPTLFGSKIIELFDDKIEFRNFLNENKISPLSFQVYGSEDWDAASVNYPCVVKPSNAQGQRGVSFVECQEQLDAAIEIAIQYSSNGSVIVEKFLDGSEFSANVVVQAGEIKFCEFTDRMTFPEGYFGLPRGHRIPATFINECQLLQSNDYIEKVLHKLNIEDAVLYVQMKLDGEIPKIIEIAPRLDGCHIWRLIKSYRGYDLRHYAIDCLLSKELKRVVSNNVACGQPIELLFNHMATGSAFSPSVSSDKGILYKEHRYKEGEKVIGINGKYEVVGYCIKNG